jgi:hypothetical protein
MPEDSNGNEDEGRSESTAYETRDIKVRPLLAFVAGFVVLLAFSLLVALWAFRLLNARQTALDAAGASTSTLRRTAPAPVDEQTEWPQPRLQSRPAADLDALRSEEDATINGYGWVDRAGGVVRVPIGVAMQLVLKEGLPIRHAETERPAVASPKASSAAPVIASKPSKGTQKSP